MSPRPDAAMPANVTAAEPEGLADEIAEAIRPTLERFAAEAPVYLRAVTDNLYEALLTSAQDYIVENGQWNIGGRIRAAEAESARLRASNADLLSALRAMIPDNLGKLPANMPDSEILPVDMSFGEIRAARAAIARATGAAS